MFWAAVGVACSTFVVLALVASQLLADVSIAKTVVDRRPNPYIHLDPLLDNSTLDVPPFVNFPPTALQFSKSDGSRRKHEEGRDHMTEIGKVFPEDRHVVANDTVSLT